MGEIVANEAVVCLCESENVEMCVREREINRER